MSWTLRKDDDVGRTSSQENSAPRLADLPAGDRQAEGPLRKHSLGFGLAAVGIECRLWNRANLRADLDRLATRRDS